MSAKSFSSEELAQKFESYLKELNLQTMKIEAKETYCVAIVFSGKSQKELGEHFSSCVPANLSCRDIWRVMLSSSDFNKYFNV